MATQLGRVAVGCVILCAGLATAPSPSLAEQPDPEPVVEGSSSESGDAPEGGQGEGPPVEAGASRAFSHGLLLSGGPLFGGTLNGDQWAAGAALRLDGICLVACAKNLGVEVQVLYGFAGNFMTGRASARLVYGFEFGRHFAFYPAVGGSLVYHFPVGPFRQFCEETGLDDCHGFSTGLEVGGGFRFFWLSAEAIVGFGNIPRITLAAVATFPLWSSRGRRGERE